MYNLLILSKKSQPGKTPERPAVSSCLSIVKTFLKHYKFIIFLSDVTIATIFFKINEDQYQFWI